MIIQSLLCKYFRDGTIENKTFDNDEETSVNVITNTPELAYFSKEGKIIKELEW